MIRLILNIILLIALAVFVSLNVPYRTTVNLFGAVMKDVSVVAVVLLALVTGVLYSFLTYTTSWLVRRRANRHRERAVRTKEKERELREREKDIERSALQEPAAAPVAVPPEPVAEPPKKRKSRLFPSGGR